MLKILFAPLQGYTENVYRIAHHKFCGGISAYYAPFLRIEKGEPRSKDLRDLPLVSDLPLGMNLVPQVIASDSYEFNKLVDAVVALGYNEIDINMGCPFPMQTKAGRGSALLQNEEQFCSIISAIKERQGISFSIKMRLGLESREEALRLLPCLNDSPISRITLHPRLGIQQYKGHVDMEGFELFYNGCEHPLIYNGDIGSIEQIADLEKRFPRLAGIMIGRGLLARPTLASEYASGLEVSAEERLARTLQMHEFVFDYYEKKLQGDSQVLMKLKPFWEYQEQIMPKKIFKGIMKSGNLKNYLSAVGELA